MQGQRLYFYHQATKIATTVFGSLFSNIYVAKDNELVAVPINYGGVPKHLIDNTNDDERNMIDRQLPAMSYSISSFLYDSVKKLGNGKNGSIKVCCDDKNVDAPSEFIVGNASPWVIGFQLKIKAKTLDEGFQIIEQIIPYFSPKLSVDIKDFNDLLGDCKYSRSDITLSGFDHTNDFEGEFEEKRELEWVMNFDMTVPYWGFISGYPGVAGGLGTGITNPNITVGTDYCTGTDGLTNSYIEHVFVNYMTEDYVGQAGPGIPADPEIEEFLPEAGALGHVSTTRIDYDETTETSTAKYKNYPSENVNVAPVISGDLVYENDIHNTQTILINPIDEFKSVEILSLPRYGTLISNNNVLQMGDTLPSTAPILFVPNTALIAGSVQDTLMGTTQHTNPIAQLSDWGVEISPTIREITVDTLKVQMRINQGAFIVNNSPYPSDIGIGLSNTIDEFDPTDVLTYSIEEGNVNRIRLALDGLDSEFQESYYGANDSQSKIKISAYRTDDTLIDENSLSAETIINNKAVFEFNSSEEVSYFEIKTESLTPTSFVIRKVEFSRTLHDNFSYYVNGAMTNEYMIHDYENKSQLVDLYDKIIQNIFNADHVITYKELSSTASDLSALIFDNFISEEINVNLVLNSDGYYDVIVLNFFTGQATIKYDVSDGFSTVEAKLILNII